MTGKGAETVPPIRPYHSCYAGIMAEGEGYEVVYYETASGRSPVREFIATLPVKAQVKCDYYITRLQGQGTFPHQHATHLGGDIWELPPEYANVEYRLFYGRLGRRFVMVHAMTKERNAVPRREIELAQRRFEEAKNTMPWKTHSEHIKKQMANPEYAAAYAEMKAELDREFQRAEEDESQPFAEIAPAKIPAHTTGNGTSRRAHAEKTGRASDRE